MAGSPSPRTLLLHACAWLVGDLIACLFSVLRKRGLDS
jgi:hypothetical protein